jgi:hypothetical protein
MLQRGEIVESTFDTALFQACEGYVKLLMLLYNNSLLIGAILN